MALDTDKNHNNIKNEEQKARRSFLKKTVYAAPSIMVLGQLARPTGAVGASTIDDTDGPGGGNGGGFGGGGSSGFGPQ